MEPTKVMTDTARQLEDSRGLHVLTLDAGDVVDIGCDLRPVLGPQRRDRRRLLAHRVPNPTSHAGRSDHRHSREDKYSFVLERRMATVLGDQVVYAKAWELTFKPCGQWHTVWNPDAEPSRILEIVSPGGFERFFEEFAASLHQLPMPPVRRGDLGAPLRGRDRYYGSVRLLCAEQGLDHPLLRVVDA